MLARLPRRAVYGLIRAYQLTLSGFLGRRCRYLPTCSAYAAEAVMAHGAWPGTWMGLARVCRCHPWGGSGFDPPPPTRAAVPWYRPWDHGSWRARTRPAQERASSSAASP